MVRWVRTPLPMLEQLAATYGPAFSVRIPRMPEPMVFFSDPAAPARTPPDAPAVPRRSHARLRRRDA
jgi:hypothetical protein